MKSTNKVDICTCGVLTSCIGECGGISFVDETKDVQGQIITRQLKTHPLEKFVPLSGTGMHLIE